MSEDIIRMAREAGFSVIDSPESWNESMKILERFAALVRADEREACAKVCEEDAFVEQWKGLAEAAQRIRARGQL